MLRDGNTGDWIGTFAGHKGAVWSCRLDPSGSLAATASGDFSVRVWDAVTGVSLYHYTDAKHIVKTCDFSPSSTLLATGGHDGILRVYNMMEPKAKPMEIKQDASKKVAISKCLWISDTMLLTGCGDGSIRFWTINGTTPPTAPDHVMTTDEKAEVRDMEIRKITDGRTILTVAAGHKVYFFDLDSHQRVSAHKMPIHFKDEGGASLHPSGDTFIAGGSDLWVRVFDFKTGAELDCLKGHHGPIRCLRYSPSGTTFASGSEDGTIRLWKTNPDES